MFISNAEEECGIKSQEIGKSDVNILMMKDDICFVVKPMSNFWKEIK